MEALRCHALYVAKGDEHFSHALEVLCEILSDMVAVNGSRYHWPRPNMPSARCLLDPCWPQQLASPFISRVWDVDAFSSVGTCDPED